MKKLYSIITTILFALILQAQAPQKMSYQAVIRNSSDVLVVNTQIGMQISILQGSANGAAVYVETQRPNTNANGLVSIEIGAGEVESGSFAGIDWQSGPYFIKTETDPDGQDNYSITGTSQILSVPFALHAQTAESANETDPEFNAWDKSTGINIDKEQVNGLGDYIETENDPVFEQSAASGITETDTENWNNKLDEESDPVFGTSPAASITEADKERWDSREEFSGSYTDLSNKPENLGDFTNDVGYQLRIEDEDTDNRNEIQTIYINNNNIGLTKGGGSFRLDQFETDPVFDVWNKSTGISITESQISDLDHFTNADETDRIYSTDSSYIKTGTRSWNNSLVKKITESDTSYWGRAETDPYYAADSAFIKSGVRNWNSSVSKGIVESDTAYWNDKTYISDTDGDTKITTEQSSDEDIIRLNIAGNEAFTADDTGFDFVLPTNDDNSNLKVSKNNGTVVFGVDGRGMMYGDGSGLSNVKSLANTVGGNQLCQITKNYAWYQNVRSVTIQTPSSGKCFVMASGYVRWESKGWDLYLASILRNSDPNESWDAENDFFRHLNIATDYNCADSSDQYASFAQHRCFNVGAGNQTFTLWVNKYSSSAKVRMDDVNLTVLFFPTGGTGGGILKSTQLDTFDEQQDPNVPFTSIPRRPDGSELRKRLDAMISEERKPEKLPDDELIELQKTIDDLKADNESLRQEKRETDKRISDIENQIKQLLITNKGN